MLSMEGFKEMKRKHDSDLVKGKQGNSDADEISKKKNIAKGKKKMKASDPDFEREELEDTEEEGTEESGSGTSGESGSESGEDDQPESDEVEEVDSKKELWETLLADKITTGKQKGGPSVKSKGKQKQKVIDKVTPKLLAVKDSKCDEVIDKVTPKLLAVIDSKCDEVLRQLYGMMCMGIDRAKGTRKANMPKEVVREVTNPVGEESAGGTVVAESISIINSTTVGEGLPGKEFVGAEAKGGVDGAEAMGGLDGAGAKEGLIGAEAKEGLGAMEGPEFESASDAELEDEKNDDMEPGPQIVVGLLGTRGTTVLVDAQCTSASYSSCDEEDDCDGIGEKSGDKRVVKPTQAALFSNAAKSRRHTSCEARLIKFVKDWKLKKDPLSPGTVLIKCDHQEASQRDCYEVVHYKSRVSTDYVRMASVLYNKQWATREFVNRSKRIMLDPSYSNRLMLNEGKEEHIADKYCKLLLSYKLSQIRAVFVPVLEVPKDSPDESHWWCLALDMKGQQLWMIDSLYPDPFTKHAEVFELLVSGLDALFEICDPQWTSGQLKSWTRCTFEVLEPRDNTYCGVFMLACIKFFARRFTTKFGVGRITPARENLFLDDVQCECNELKDVLGDLTAGSRMSTRNH